MNNTQVDNAKDLDAVISMYNLTEYSDSCYETFQSFWEYYRKESSAAIVNSE